jgi:hypothetical protein
MPAFNTVQRGAVRARLSLVACALATLALPAAASAQYPVEKPTPEPVEPADGGTTTTDPRATLIGSAYKAGLARNMRVVPADSVGWHRIARMTNLGYDALVSSYDAIHVVNTAYRELLQRQADSTGAVFWVGRLRGGEHWHTIWGEIAQSAERHSRFKAWAPAPFATPEAARARFGLPFTPTPEQCFGALGHGCDGGVPSLTNSNVAPFLTNRFTMPDGTSMGYVSIGVAVGSILHDNVCFRDRAALNCTGIGGGDLVKSGAWPGSMEWNKAVWNVNDNRTWRHTFGPYPVDPAARKERWYDDMRLAQTRVAYMAPVVSLLTIPYTTELYSGGETTGTKQLGAPAGARLDSRDADMCRSKVFSWSGISVSGLSPSGVCQ